MGDRIPEGARWRSRGPRPHDPGPKHMSVPALPSDQAYWVLYERHKPQLMQVACAKLSEEEAEVFVDDTLIDHFLRPEYAQKPDGETRRLLRVSLKNRLRDRDRELSRRLPGHFDGQELVDGSGFSVLGEVARAEERLLTQVAAEACWKELRAAFERAKKRLADSRRAALEAHLHSGDRYREVAERLGLTENAVTLKINRAVHQICEALEPRWSLRDFAPLRRLQVSQLDNRTQNEQADLRLLELIAGPASKRLKEDFSAAVDEALRSVDPEVRAALTEWIRRGCHARDLDRPDRDRALRGVKMILRALQDRDLVLLERFVYTFSGATQRNRKNVNGVERGERRGPGAEPPLLRWCRDQLLPRVSDEVKRKMRRQPMTME